MNENANGGFAIDALQICALLKAVADFSNVAKVQGQFRLNDNPVDLHEVCKLALNANRIGLIAVIHPPEILSRCIKRIDAIANIRHRKLVCLQHQWIDNNFNSRSLSAHDLRVDNAIDRFQFRPDFLLGKFSQPVYIAFAQHVNLHHRGTQVRGIKALYSDPRSLGQKRLQARDAALELQQCEFHIRIGRVRNAYPTTVLARKGLIRLNAFEFAHFSLDGHHQISLDLFGRIALLSERDKDFRVNEFGKYLNGQPVQ